VIMLLDMLPMLSPDLCALDQKKLKELLRVATRSILAGINDGRRTSGYSVTASEILRHVGASFVTLRQRDALRGCVGSLERGRPLVDDVAWNAFAAAFQDPRFPALSRSELKITSVEVSILSTPQLLEFSDEKDLLAQLRPGIDGLIISYDGQRATYLPNVWEALPNPQVFVHQLRHKAEINPNIPITTIEFRRYTTQHSPHIVLV